MDLAFRNVSNALRILLGILTLVLFPRNSQAVDFMGTVTFEGNVVFAAPIPGISFTDLEIMVRDTAEGTGSGEKCSILSVTADSPDGGGTYPDGGMVTAEILIERGGPKIPEGDCIVVIEARGTDGASVSAKGTETLFVSAAEVDTSATVMVPTITVRESKAVARLDKDCKKWLSQQIQKRRRCNFLLLKNGAAKADKCSDAGLEPPACDPGDHVEALLALSHGLTDQQTSPLFAEAIDFSLLKPQGICQKKIALAAAGFAITRMNRVRSKCLNKNLDSAACRQVQTNESKKKFDKIDTCTGDQMVDAGSGLPVPDIDPPCDTCIDGLGVIDRKCLKSCLELAVAELTDGIIGDVPECGNGILQAPEVCDDGNMSGGDCCSPTCTAENLGDQTCGMGICEVTVPVCQGGEAFVCTPGAMETEGPMGDPSCGDGLDNDCDGDTDGADVDCQ
jgi:cysteine-rich repeat protein